MGKVKSLFDVTIEIIYQPPGLCLQTLSYYLVEQQNGVVGSKIFILANIVWKAKHYGISHFSISLCYVHCQTSRWVHRKLRVLRPHYCVWQMSIILKWELSLHPVASPWVHSFPLLQLFSSSYHSTFFLQIKLFQLSPFEETVYISSTLIILFMPTITLKFKSRIWKGYDHYAVN